MTGISRAVPEINGGDGVSIVDKAESNDQK